MSYKSDPSAMNKKNTSSKNTVIKKSPAKSTWKHRRELLSNSIPLEIDLQSRQLFLNEKLNEKLDLNFKTDNLDTVITSYLLPKESKKVMQSLSKAEKGLEKPIAFNFVHPLTSKAFHFEYHYKIVYVKYSSTRLQGELVKTPSKQLRK